MKVNGQLEVAQLEQLTSDPALAPTGRMYVNVNAPAAALPKMFDGTKWQQLAFSSQSALFSQNSGTSCTVDWSKGLNQQVILSGHCVISFTNPVAGAQHRLVVTQKTYNTVNTLYGYRLNMIDQDSRRQAYQPITALQPSDNAVYTWVYTAGIRSGYATIPASIGNPTSLPGTAATGIALSPDGKYVQVGQSSSPFVNSYSFFDAGVRAEWGLKNIVANTAAVATMVGLDYSPDGNFLFGASGTTPFIQGWHLAVPNGNTSTVLANPSTPPTGAAKCVAVHPTGAYVGVGHATTPFMSIYSYSGTGYGTKSTDPLTVPAAAVTSLAFAPTGDYLAVASQTSPFIQAYPFDPLAGGIGPLISAPPTLPVASSGPAGSLGRGIAWRPQGDFIAMASNAGSFIYVVGFNRASGAFTSTILSDLTAVAANCVAWTPDGQYLIVGLNATPFLRIYDFSSQTLSTTLTFDGSNPGQAVNDIIVHPNGEFVSLALNVSPFIMGYPLPTKVRNYLKI